MLVARRFVVSGRVQGVGFRWFLQEKAAIEGAVGWVRNQPDGTVEALIQGESEAVSRIDRQIRRGPPAARVASVEVADEPASSSYTAFLIDG